MSFFCYTFAVQSFRKSGITFSKTSLVKKELEQILSLPRGVCNKTLAGTREGNFKRFGFLIS